MQWTFSIYWFMSSSDLTCPKESWKNIYFHRKYLNSFWHLTYDNDIFMIKFNCKLYIITCLLHANAQMSVFRFQRRIVSFATPNGISTYLSEEVVRLRANWMDDLDLIKCMRWMLCRVCERFVHIEPQKGSQRLSPGIFEVFDYLKAEI